MPLTPFQIAVLRCIAANRTPESHVTDGAALNRKRPCLTGSLDIFHDAAAPV